jgi:hypothetical protein
MFRTEERESLCDLLLPPEGYRVVGAVATTYSLDFVALTAVAGALGDCRLADEGDWSAPEIARAVLGLKTRLVIFVNQGAVSPGSAAGAHRLSCLYDRVIVPISIRDGAFHPKIWVVKYEPLRRGRLR